MRCPLLGFKQDFNKQITLEVVIKNADSLVFDFRIFDLLYQALVGTLMAPNFGDAPSKNLLEVFVCCCTFSAKFAISIHVL